MKKSAYIFLGIKYTHSSKVIYAFYQGGSLRHGVLMIVNVKVIIIWNVMSGGLLDSDVLHLQCGRFFFVGT